MPDVLRCPNCGGEVAPLTVVDGRLVMRLEHPPATIFSARVRCGACGTWVHFSARRKEVALAAK